MENRDFAMVLVGVLLGVLLLAVCVGVFGPICFDVPRIEHARLAGYAQARDSCGASQRGQHPEPYSYWRGDLVGKMYHLGFLEGGLVELGADPRRDWRYYWQRDSLTVAR